MTIEDLKNYNFDSPQNMFEMNSFPMQQRKPLRPARTQLCAEKISKLQAEINSLEDLVASNKSFSHWVASPRDNPKVPAWTVSKLVPLVESQDRVNDAHVGRRTGEVRAEEMEAVWKPKGSTHRLRTKLPADEEDLFASNNEESSSRSRARRASPSDNAIVPAQAWTVSKPLAASPSASPLLATTEREVFDYDRGNDVSQRKRQDMIRQISKSDAPSNDEDIAAMLARMYEDDSDALGHSQ